LAGGDPVVRLRALGAALAAATLVVGCTVGAGGVYGPIGGPRPRSYPPVVEDDQGGYGAPEGRDGGSIDPVYDDGYSRGWEDREEGRTPEYDRWQGEYDRASERSFRTGYADGYQRRPHRYGETAPDVAPVVPDWLAGEFRGWDEEANVEVVLQVRRDGGATLTGGGRSQGGVYRDGRLELRKGAWRVQRVRGGVEIAPEWDPGSRVVLQRR